MICTFSSPITGDLRDVLKKKTTNISTKDTKYQYKRNRSYRKLDQSKQQRLPYVQTDIALCSN